MNANHDKAALRELAQDARRQFPPKERAAATRLVCQHGKTLVCKLAEQNQMTIVSGFWPIHDEIDIRPLMIELSKAGLTCSLPVVDQKNSPLIFRQWQLGEPLKEDELGLHQPREDAPLVAPHILIVPLLAFDADGNRLGWGGGYYDRTLAAFRETSNILTVGVGFSLQQVDKLPQDRHDQRLDFMVTEKGSIEFS
ncbi:MAG: 5-formyltetrahydrofolate cyclo-ligase [Rhodospirillales bacterium]|jgi:5-formyltetrahydrofolate cyclo-ligase